MTSLALILSFHEYTGELSPLPGCRQDGEAVYEILKSSSKFDEIVFINSETKSRSVKQSIADFIGSHKSKSVSEFIFYFSGHGEYTDKDFLYLLTDYKRQNRNTTSLQNSELDNLIRSLNPNLFVKIVDACHSGISYIKNSTAFDEYLSKSTGKFNKIYFMYSSQYSQASYQNSHMSDFTESIVRSVNADSSGSIRYKDVMDFVSDEFESLGYQTPHFVAQAEFTEIFCHPTLEMKNRISKFLTLTPSEAARTKELSTNSESIISATRREAETYCSEDEAIQLLESLPLKFDAIDLSEDIKDIFVKTISIHNDLDIPSKSSIGEWLENNKSNPPYFAKPNNSSRTSKRKVPRNPTLMNAVAASALHTSSENDFTFENFQEKFISGFKITMNAPYIYISIQFESEFPNVSAVQFYIVPILSRTIVRFFWTSVRYEYVDWTTRNAIEDPSWFTNSCPSKNPAMLSEIIEEISINIKDSIEAPIRLKWAKIDSSDN